MGRVVRGGYNTGRRGRFSPPGGPHGTIRQRLIAKIIDKWIGQTEVSMVGRIAYRAGPEKRTT